MQALRPVASLVGIGVDQLEPSAEGIRKGLAVKGPTQCAFLGLLDANRVPSRSFTAAHFGCFVEIAGRALNAAAWLSGCCQSSPIAICMRKVDCRKLTHSISEGFQQLTSLNVLEEHVSMDQPDQE